MRCSRYPLCVLLAVGLVAGCQQAAVAPTAVEGKSSYRFLDPTPPAEKEAQIAAGTPWSMEQVINAQPILPLAEPVYPPVALAAHAGMATVGVRIVVDEEGRVAEVTSSLASLTMPSLYAAEFRAAVDAAVAQWRFRPAERRQLETVAAAGGDFRRVVKREKIEWAFDLEFTFNATGDVLARLPK